jgi:geranylgeranyl diphosphate synthase type II
VTDPTSTADTDLDSKAAVALAAALEQRLGLVEAVLERALPPEGTWPDAIHRAIRYSLFAGGKRLRPLLALAAGEAVGGTRADILPFACAVEMIHTYSLVHDDLPAMDDDDLRRGKPTSHRVFGEAIAILAGDALLTRAFHILAEAPPEVDASILARRLRTIALLGRACGTQGLIGGQVQDLQSEGKTVDAAGLERIHRAKTGALLGACVSGGALLGGAGEPELELLERFGRAIGLAFQIVDDILDATEDASSLGKTAGKDAAAVKATYVRVHGLSRAREMADALLTESLAAISPLGERGVLLAALARQIVNRRR